MESTKSKRRVRDYGEVFTGEREVKAMLDMVPMTIEETFLEPSFGTGNFLKEILVRKLKLCLSKDDRIRALNSIYGVEILQDNVDETIETLSKLVPDIENSKDIMKKNLICGNFLTELDSQGNHIWFL